MKRTRIIVGARGSLLSVAQTAGVIRLLKSRAPAYEFVFNKITTLGDTAKIWLRSDTGIFVKELEDALLSGKIDLAVHSVKDLPYLIPPELVLAAITKREEPRDALISKNKSAGLEELSPGAKVGTTSLRRRAQLLRERPDLKVEDLRGNLDTRIRKLKSRLYDAIIVAAAGLKRLGYDYEGVSCLLLDEKIMLPAPGQGALGIEVRKNDIFIEKLVKKLEDPATRCCVDAERAFLGHTGAGCRMPVAAFAKIRQGRIFLEGLVISLDGKRISRAGVQGRSQDAKILGRKLAETVLKNGGKEILKEIKNG